MHFTVARSNLDVVSATKRPRILQLATTVCVMALGSIRNKASRCRTRRISMNRGRLSVRGELGVTLSARPLYLLKVGKEAPPQGLLQTGCAKL